jgi:hypothetical protein
MIGKFHVEIRVPALCLAQVSVSEIMCAHVLSRGPTCAHMCWHLDGSAQAQAPS